MLEQPLYDFRVVAARLVEAACCARDGDGERAKAHIADAIALLQGQPGPATITAATTRHSVPRVGRGSLAAWQARRLTTYIDSHLSATIHIEDLARLLGLSISHFCRVFKGTFGVSAHDFVTRRRIAVAQGLMVTTTEPLSAIALSCGMSDQSHFTRSFRRIVGETPNSWRRTRRGELG